MGKTREKKMKLLWLLGLLQAVQGFDKTLKIEGLKIHGDGTIGTSDSVNFRFNLNRNMRSPTQLILKVNNKRVPLKLSIMPSKRAITLYYRRGGRFKRRGSPAIIRFRVQNFYNLIVKSRSKFRLR